MLSSQEWNKLRFLRLEQSNALELDIGVGGPQAFDEARTLGDLGGSQRSQGMLRSCLLGEGHKHLFGRHLEIVATS